MKTKFAWTPLMVKTWRPKGTKAIIWLQKYREDKNGRYVNYLGFFSYEFYN